MNEVDPTQKGFIGALFDFSFKSYVTPKIIKVIFGVIIVVSALGALFVAIIAFKASAVVGVFVLLIISPLIFFFYVIIYRMLLEVVMAVFTIAENTTRMATFGATANPGAAGPGAPG